MAFEAAAASTVCTAACPGFCPMALVLNYGLGCPECNPPGSTCRVVVESKRLGELWLRVSLQTMCACMSFHGAPEPEEEEWIYSVLPPAPKPAAKTKGAAKPAAKKKRKR